jgi:hypothetical protein
MRKENVRAILFLFTVATLLTVRPMASAQEAVPMLINYQGELRSPATGEILPDGTYDLVFRIYEVESGGSPLWEGAHSSANGNPVQLANGIFSAILGSGTGNALDAWLFEGADRWLEIQVGGETLNPRQRITSTAFSIVSENSRLLDGREVSDFVIQSDGLRLESNEISPNIVGGYVLNRVTDGAIGATVSGGGETGLENRVSDSFGTVGGGRNNQAGDDAGTVNDKPGATVGGGAWNIASGRGATVGGGLGNQVTADYATIAGGGRVDPANPLLGNFVFDHYGSIGGGGNNRAGNDDADPTNATYATVGGGGTNWATGQGATIGGGFVNEASGYAATISGGDSNTAGGDYSVVGGGFHNGAEALYATIAGGGPSDPLSPSTTSNRVTDDYGTIGGGSRNQAGNNAGTTDDADHATVGGGYHNLASGEFTTIGGGGANTAEGNTATIAGGWNSVAQGYCATVGGGMWNEAANDLATVGGGDSNSATAAYATVGGGSMNQAIARYATVSGGGSTDGLVYTANRVTDEYGTVGGGGNNQAGDNAGAASDANFATVGGGHSNIAGAFSATVAGGAVNTANAAWAAIGGGNYNKVTDEYGTVAGGSGNQAGDDAGTTQDVCSATVGGGQGNTASFRWSTIAGGQDNTASNLWASVGGGGWNIASGARSSIGGGCENTTSGAGAAVPGGYFNTAAGDYSFAAGFRAKADHNGAFVWGDSQNADVTSTANDQVTFRCLGGVRFLSGSGGANQMISWAPGDSSWTPSSDRNLKENFVEIDSKEVLERVSRLPITEWNFKGYSLRHIGPVAQDFQALFPLGGSDTTIDSGDLQGVSLAAIQGLHKIVQEKDAEISTLKKQNAELEARLAVVESLVKKLVDGTGAAR